MILEETFPWIHKVASKLGHSERYYCFCFLSKLIIDCFIKLLAATPLEALGKGRPRGRGVEPLKFSILIFKKFRKSFFFISVTTLRSVEVTSPEIIMNFPRNYANFHY